MAQGDNVCREAVFEQDTPVSLAVQLSDEAVPVDHEAWAEPATQKQSAFLLEHHCCRPERGQRNKWDAFKLVFEKRKKKKAYK